MIANHPIYGGDWLSCVWGCVGVISYHVTLSRGSHDSQSPHIRKHLCPILWQQIYLSQNYSYYVRGDRSPLTDDHSGLYKKVLEMFLLVCNTLFILRVRLSTSDPCFRLQR